jgi:outer membrane receptor protein involved in Fe transport
VDYTNIGTPIDYLNPVEPSKSDYVYGAETRKHANQIVPGFYVQEEFEPVSWCILNGGLRYDQVTREQKDVGTGAESKVKPEHLTPNIGVTVRLFDILEWGSKSDALNLFGTYAQGFFPNFRGAGFEEIVVLKPEVSENKEVGLKGIFFGKSLQANLSYFQLSIKDKVVYTIDNQLENAGIYSSNGVELELRGRPFSDTDFEIYGGWTNLDTKWKYYMASGGVNLSGKYIQLVPKNMYLLGTNCSLGAFKIWIQGRYVGARYIDALNVNTDPAHFLGDIGIAYKYGKNLNISLNVLNFTDALYYGTTTFTKKNLAYVGNPREISLNMSLKF